MPDIRLSSDLMSKVDKIAAEKEMSRNKLVNKIIEKYVEASDSFVSDILPDVVRSIVKDEIKKRRYFNRSNKGYVCNPYHKA